MVIRGGERWYIWFPLIGGHSGQVCGVIIPSLRATSTSLRRIPSPNFTAARKSMKISMISHGISFIIWAKTRSNKTRQSSIPDFLLPAQPSRFVDGLIVQISARPLRSKQRVMPFFFFYFLIYNVNNSKYKSAPKTTNNQKTIGENK